MSKSQEERINHLGSVISTLELQIKVLSERHNKDVQEIYGLKKHCDDQQTKYLSEITELRKRIRVEGEQG